ncbi:pumilio homolog 5 isoform X1 [Prunus yedoensis var. nudiflora]|uniref:Pumilio homolog 5 isoform X1 n=1 Tax=Prunus yedoensis var. nudiflora TaxID=2094558 RepID=A0A314XZ65_PRUYE|nr:pumilio homolog 5 isoform X1 [Prunus yedoensis var. nudiflora]
MLFFERMSAQHLNETGIQTPTTPSPRSASKKLTSPFRCLSLKKIEEPDDEIEHLQQPENDPYQDIETSYVAQICLSWEALHCQYTQLNQLITCQPDNPNCYNHSAQQFQQFQVLLQRFIENEPFEEGHRAEIYARTQRHLPKLLRVPDIQSPVKKGTEEEESDYMVHAPDLIKIIETSILTFQLFVKMDKKKTSSVLNLFGNQNQAATPLQQIQSSLEKKWMKLKELRNKRKGWKKKSWPQSQEDVQLLFSLIDAKVLLRVLRMLQTLRNENVMQATFLYFSNKEALCFSSLKHFLYFEELLPLPGPSCYGYVIQVLMATEGLTRMVESSRGKKWPSSKDAATFGSPLISMAAEDSCCISKGRSFRRDRTEVIPNRSGSAPPSMEDPAYLAYYLSNMNLNASLPPPLILRENHHMVRQIGGLGTNRRLPSLDDSSNGSLHLSQGSLSTHKEDPTDARSATISKDNLAETSGAVMPVKNTASLASYNKSLVDLIQQDFPRTPSPVYNQSLPSSLGTTDEQTDTDVHSISPNASSLNKSKLPEPNSGSTNDCSDTSSLDAHAVGEPQKDESNIEHDDGLGNNASISGDLGLDLSRVRASNVDINNNKQNEKQSYGRYVPQDQFSTQQSVPYQLQGVQTQLVSQGMNHLQSGMENLPHGYPKFSSIDIQPSLHSPGFTPPLYTTTAAYMTSGNPFYPNYQPSGIFPAQYGAGGYALGSTFLPSYMPGYASHGSFPMPFDATSGPSFNGRTADVSRGERIPHGGNMQHPSRFYGQHGPMLQPPFLDPVNMQYYPRPLEDAYGASSQYGHLASRVIGGQLSQQELYSTAYTGDQNFQSSSIGNLGIPSPRKVGINGSGYYGNNSTMPIMTQFPASPLGSPILPSSPVGRTNHLGRKNEIRFPQGRIVEFSVDQHGSRFIQQKLEHCTAEDKASVFKEILPRASKLMTDVFGNYVIQKFFEYGSAKQKKELADQLAGQMLPLSLQMYGCRVIQKALEVIELDQKTQLVHELDGHVLKFSTLSTHPYGCRVIQRVLEHCSDDIQSQSIVDEILESTYALAKTSMGIMLPSTWKMTSGLEFWKCCSMHVLERGKPYERSQIISKLIGKIVQLSQHKYASNVVEKCLEHGDVAERELLIEEIIGQMEENDSLLPMMKDQFANYVVQKLFGLNSYLVKMAKPQKLRGHRV